MVRKIILEGGGLVWEIEKPDGQKMWMNEYFMKALINNPEIKKFYNKEEQK